MGGITCREAQGCCAEAAERFAIVNVLPGNLSTSEGYAGEVGNWSARSGGAPGVVQYYRDWGSIVRALQSSGVVLVRASWVEDLQRQGGGLPRRQELPPEAIWGAKHLVEALQDSKREAPRIVAISHSWLTKEHPDPYGYHLSQYAPLLRQFARHARVPLEDVAVFIDWCSLPQAPRSQEEERAFNRALSHMDLWFTHWLTHVWLLTRTPDGVAPYDSRGWTTFERAVAGFVTPPESVLDLGLLRSGRKNWGQVILDCQVERRPPVLPEAFATQLSKKQFAHESDRDLVLHGYRETFHQVMDFAEQLWYGSLGWRDKEVKDLAVLLPRCTKLRELELQGNDIGAEGAVAISEALPHCKSLVRVNLEENQLIGASVRGLREVWVSAGRDPAFLEVGNQRPAGQRPEGKRTDGIPKPAVESGPRDAHEQLSTLLARQAAFEARVDAAVARLSGGLADVADAVGVRPRHLRVGAAAIYSS